MAELRSRIKTTRRAMVRRGHHQRDEAIETRLKKNLGKEGAAAALTDAVPSLEHIFEHIFEHILEHILEHIFVIRQQRRMRFFLSFLPIRRC